MSGHSKWSQIKRQKGLTDQKRANVFTKLGRYISIAVRESGGITDPGMNFKLRLAIEKARQSNMPKTNIDRAIEQGAGRGAGGAMQTGMYEGYGPGGIAIMVETVSDNAQRTYSDLRHLFDRGGGVIGQPGSVSFMFDHVGRIEVCNVKNVDSVTLELMDISGIVDVEENENNLVIYTDAKELKSVQEQLNIQRMNVTDAGLVMKPKQTVSLEEEMVEKVGNFLELLEENDDVQKVYTNVDAAYV